MFIYNVKFRHWIVKAYKYKPYRNNRNLYDISNIIYNFVQAYK